MNDFVSALRDISSADQLVFELTLVSALPDIALHSFFYPDRPSSPAFSLPTLFLEGPHSTSKTHVSGYSDTLDVLHELGPLSMALVLLESLRLYHLLAPVLALPALPEPALLSIFESGTPSPDLLDHSRLAPRSIDVLRTIRDGLGPLVSQSSEASQISAPLPISSVQVALETPIGASQKVELDPVSCAVVSSRALPKGVTYPFAYGFFPHTLSSLNSTKGVLSGDGDPLDAVVFSSSPDLNLEAFSPGMARLVRPIGLALVVDQGGLDPKVLCVDAADATFDSVHSLEELPAPLLAAFYSFMRSYKGDDLKRCSLVLALLDERAAWSAVSLSAL